MNKTVSIERLSGRRKGWRCRWRDDSGVRRSLSVGSRAAAEALKRHKERELVQVVGGLSEEELRLVLEHRKGLGGVGGVLLGAAVEQYRAEAAARGYRPSTLDSMRVYLDGWVKELGPGVPVAGIDAAAVVAYVTSRYTGEVSRRSLAARIGPFLRWCEDKGWRGPLGRLRWRPSRADRAGIGFWRADAVAAFQGALREDLRGGMALGWWAGVRPDELLRLDWSAVDCKRQTVLISGAVAKTRRERVLHGLPDNLWEWVAAYGRKSGRVVPANKRNFAEHRRRAVAEVGLEWPRDCARHSFATHAYWRGYEWAAAILGHESGPRVFFGHYRGLATEEDAGMYWAVRP